MVDGLWFSILAGAGVGIVYGLASYVNYRVALGVSEQMFLFLTVGGILLRMALCLGTILLVLLLTDIHRWGFVGGFMATFAIGLLIEVTLLHRHLQRQSPFPHPASPITEHGSSESL